jgi:hypothetical protein
VKHQNFIKSEFYKKKSKKLIIERYTLAMPSRFDALCRLVDEDLSQRIKVLGFWDCNITSVKIREVLQLLEKSKVFKELEISDNQSIIKKKAVKGIIELFKSLSKKQIKYSILVQRSLISIKNCNMLLKNLASTQIKSLSLTEMELGNEHIATINDFLSLN